MTWLDCTLFTSPLSIYYLKFILRLRSAVSQFNLCVFFSSHFRLKFAIPKEADGKYHKCLMYNVNFTEMRAKGIDKPDQKWPMTKCRSGWEYNFTDIPYETIATELDWVCDDSYLPSLSQSVFFLGAICGGLLFGWIADRYGRIPSLALCNLVGFAAGCATAFSTSFWMFSFCRFLVGFAFDNCFTMMYILGEFFFVN